SLSAQGDPSSSRHAGTPISPGNRRRADLADRMRRFGAMTIGRKMLAGTVVAALSLVAVGVFAAWRDREVRYSDRMGATRQGGEAADGVVTYYGSLEQKGTMSRPEAQLAALGVLANMRYGHEDYFYVSDLDARMVMHPVRPELDGTDVSTMKD